MQAMLFMTDEPDVYIYTDGACSGNPGPGGWGTLLKHPETRSLKTFSGGHPRTTNNRMELQAAIEGLRALKSDKRLRVHLVSDIVWLFEQQDISCEVLAASLRSPRHVRECARAGAHISTIPFGVIRDMVEHKKTVEGMKTFVDDVVPEYRELLPGD